MQKLVHGDHSAHADDHHGHHGDLVPHEQPWNVTLPLVVLAILSVFAGFLNVPYILNNFFGGHSQGLFNEWLAPVIPLHAHHETSTIEWILMFKSVAIAAVFMFLGYKAYTKWQSSIAQFTKKFFGLYQAVYNKYYVDEFYQAFFVRGVLSLNKICFSIDRYVVDAFVNLVGKFGVIYSNIIGWFDNFFVDGVVNLCGKVTDFSGAQLKKIQTGNIQHYAYVAVFGVVAVMIIKMLM